MVRRLVLVGRQEDVGSSPSAYSSAPFLPPQNGFEKQQNRHFPNHFSTFLSQPRLFCDLGRLRNVLGYKMVSIF